MNQKLAENHLPLPNNYNGLQWDTKLLPTRKSIPKYLHEDLPKLKYQLLREQFKEISQFQCPRLQYFKKIIKPKNQTQINKKSSQKQKLNKEKTAIMQQWQYVILTNDKNSNLIDNLLEKTQEFDNKIKMRSSLTKNKEKCENPENSNKFKAVQNLRNKSLILERKRNNCKQKYNVFRLPTLGSSILDCSVIDNKTYINESTIQTTQNNSLKLLKNRLNNSLRQSNTQRSPYHNTKLSSRSINKSTYRKNNSPEINQIKCFPNTIQLMFKHQKNLLLKSKQEDPENNIKEEIMRSINQIPLIQFDE